MDDRITKYGDVWVIKNKHKIMCGDCTDEQATHKLLDGDELKLVFTSPPYGDLKLYKSCGKIDFTGLMTNLSNILIPLSGGSQWIINLGGYREKGKYIRYWDDWFHYMESIGHPLFEIYIWNKKAPPPLDMGTGLKRQHEYLFHFTFGKKKPNRIIENGPPKGKPRGGGMRNADNTDRKRYTYYEEHTTHRALTSIIDVGKQCYSGTGATYVNMLRLYDFHGSMFTPVLAEQIALTFCDDNEVVYDPFGGVGNTLLGCDRINRRARLMELDPEFIDMTLCFWLKTYGVDAVNLETGKKFSEYDLSKVQYLLDMLQESRGLQQGQLL